MQTNQISSNFETILQLSKNDFSIISANQESLSSALSGRVSSFENSLLKNLIENSLNRKDLELELTKIKNYIKDHIDISYDNIIHLGYSFDKRIILFEDNILALEDSGNFDIHNFQQNLHDLKIANMTYLGDLENKLYAIEKELNYQTTILEERILRLSSRHSS